MANVKQFLGALGMGASAIVKFARYMVIRATRRDVTVVINPRKVCVLKTSGSLLLSFALLTAACPAAQAEAIFLKCGSFFNPFAVDVTKQTVNAFPARITPIAIDWDQSNQYGSQHFHIDRSTGVMTMSGHLTGTEACTKINAPKTKF